MMVFSLFYVTNIFLKTVCKFYVHILTIYLVLAAVSMVSYLTSFSFGCTEIKWVMYPNNVDICIWVEAINELFLIWFGSRTVMVFLRKGLLLSRRKAHILHFHLIFVILLIKMLFLISLRFRMSSFSMRLVMRQALYRVSSGRCVLFEKKIEKACKQQKAPSYLLCFRLLKSEHG